MSMYAIYERRAVYDNRDGLSHFECRRLSEYAYHTVALPYRLMPGHEAEDDCISYYVADVACPTKPVPRCGHEDLEDIPF